MRVLVTGGAGFIGCGTVDHMLRLDHEVTVLDDLSRRGSELNLKWLLQSHEVKFEHKDVSDYSSVLSICRRTRFDAVIHLAAQVAVTTSVSDPRRDFEVNALGTLNVLEAIRETSPDAVLVFASTNKVYGHLDRLGTVESSGRYEFEDVVQGVGELEPLDFYSPYGCSKGAADQYVLDYSRIYGLRTVVMRQSCIYGYRQFGVEDQGWVAWFIIAHILGRPITVYGNGKQVRDLLFIDDLVAAYSAAIEGIDTVVGQVFNIGGGPANTLSLIELMDRLEELSGRRVEAGPGDWRPGDQPIYVSDIRKAERELGWQPKISTRDGVERLYRWVEQNRDLF
jgi:CDP-paratose 2-epimerase